jgi:hypothetical protein
LIIFLNIFVKFLKNFKFLIKKFKSNLIKISGKSIKKINSPLISLININNKINHLNLLFLQKYALKLSNSLNITIQDLQAHHFEFYNVFLILIDISQIVSSIWYLFVKIIESIYINSSRIVVINFSHYNIKTQQK